MSALREVIARFGVSFDTKPLEKGNASISDGIAKLKGFAGALGAGLALGAIKDFIAGIIDNTLALERQAAGLRLSVGELETWNAAASVAGVSSEALGSSFESLSKGVGFGTGAAVAHLKKLGVAVDDGHGHVRNLGDVFAEAGAKLGKMPDTLQRSTLGAAIFGQQFEELLPLLSKGEAGMADLRAEVQALGAGMSGQLVKDSQKTKAELAKLDVAWTGIKTTIGAFVLPALTRLTKMTSTLIKPLIETTRHTKLLEVAAVALGVKGLLFLSNKIGPLGTGMKNLGKQTLKTIAPLLILEDLFAFLSGGDSLIGRGLEKVFGKETTEKIRRWINDAFKTFPETIKRWLTPGKFLEDWEVGTQELKRDLKRLFGDDFGEMLSIAGGFFTTFIDVLTGGWENFKTKTGAIWEAMGIPLKIFAVEVASLLKIAVADVEDSFTRLWNNVLGGAKATLGKVAAGLSHLPGGGALTKKVEAAMAGLDSAQMTPDAMQKAIAERDTKRFSIASNVDNISARINGARPPDVTTTVHVTVPPGTPEETAKRVGEASASGANKGVKKANNLATRRALVPGSG